MRDSVRVALMRFERECRLRSNEKEREIRRGKLRKGREEGKR